MLQLCEVLLFFFIYLRQWLYQVSNQLPLLKVELLSLTRKSCRGFLEQTLKKEHFAACSKVSLFEVIVNEGAELSFLASLLLIVEVLAWVSLVLVRMVQSLKRGMRVDTIVSAAST